MSASPEDPRYSRQVLFRPIGVEGQRRLLDSTVALVGCGALGASLAEQLVRVGVGRLVLVDRDVVEESNLGRQALYTAQDAADGLPKVVALAGHLRAFNPDIDVDPRVSDLNASIMVKVSGRDGAVDCCSTAARQLLDCCSTAARLLLDC